MKSQEFLTVEEGGRTGGQNNAMGEGLHVTPITGFKARGWWPRTKESTGVQKQAWARKYSFP